MSYHYYPLVNKILNSLKVKNSAFHLLNLAGSDPDSLFTKPFVTVARDPGSGGAPIARLLAQKLGFEFVDQQIVDEIAHSTKQRRAIISAIDEKHRTRIDDMIHSMLNPEYVDDIKYVTELSRVIIAYALKGHVVILGRGANFLCPFGKGLHVNITAPYENRIQKAVDFEGLTPRQARKIVTETEFERRQFVKQYFKKNLLDPNYYDLTINTAYFDLEEATRVILAAFYQKFSRLYRYKALISKWPLVRFVLNTRFQLI